MARKISQLAVASSFKGLDKILITQNTTLESKSINGEDILEYISTDGLSTIVESLKSDPELSSTLDENGIMERKRGFSTGNNNGHLLVTGGDELYFMDVLEGTAWAVGGFSATFPQWEVANQKRGGLVHPLKRHMLDFEEYPILIGNTPSTPAGSGSVASSITETQRTNRAWFGVKFITEEALVDEKLSLYVYYGDSENPSKDLYFFDNLEDFSLMGIESEFTANAGDEVSIWLAPPLETDPNTQTHYVIRKASGDILNVRPTAEDPNTPYIVHLMRKFEDRAQLFLPVYQETVANEEDDRIWRYDSILVAGPTIRQNSNYPRPFHMGEWREVGTSAQYQLSNAPCVDYNQATSRMTLSSDITLEGDFKVAFHYDGDSGTTPTFTSSSSDAFYLKRDNVADAWVVAISGVEYLISDVNDPTSGSEICFSRVGTTMEVFVDDISRGTQTVPTADFIISTLGNKTTPTIESSSGRIHDVLVVNQFGQLEALWPMQESSGTISYDIIGTNNGTYVDVNWDTQDSTNHARSYGVRIEGSVNVPGRPAGIVGAESANGGQMTHYPSFGDNDCGIGDIIGFNGIIGRYKEVGTTAITSGVPFLLSADGTDLTEEYPSGIGLWDVINNRTAFAPNHQNIRPYRVRISFVFNASQASKFINVKLRLAGGTNETILEWDHGVGKQSVDVVYTSERTIWTTEDILTDQLEVYMETDVNGTLSSQEIAIIEG